MVELADDGGDRPTFDDAGKLIRIDHDDGAITISLDGSPLDQDDKPDDTRWFRNLVSSIEDNELGRISEELLRGIEEDNQSRTEWLDARTQGINLLGLKIEVPGAATAGDDAPVEGMSKVRHPLLLEACLRFQANARSELLPTDGPVKIRDDDSNNTEGEDELADALEKDLNHYLTAVATEYYPDTDRMLLMVGFGGDGFKKVYFCPLRSRPVSESVDAKDLIVNNSATDLRNAKRITHRILMPPNTVRRLQILGVYRDVELADPTPPKLNSVDQAEKQQQGITPESFNPQDRDREIYECYCELDLKGFEHKKGGKVTGLQVPYRVTLDVSSREILSIVRNYDKETADLPVARQVFVKYPYVPGFGFWDIGLLHILGNTTNAVTAAWREMLDNGMFANFPGFLIAQAAARQKTNVVRVPPGGAQQIDTQGMDIRQAVMPLPYTTQQMPALMDLVQDIAGTGQRIGGTAEMQVGEGRPDAPVGTTLALIEQATRIENAVHKRLHAAQALEFQLLVQCFREHPESFLESSGKSQSSGRSAMTWDEATFLKALDDYELVPQADPNTASHTQRLMKVGALVQAAEGNPQLFNVQEVQKVALRTMGWSNPEQFINANPQPSPKDQAETQKAQTEAKKGDAALIGAHAKAAEVQAKTQQGGFAGGGLAGAQPQQPEPPNPLDVAKLHLQAQELEQDRQEDLLEAENRERDRESDERLGAVQLMVALLKAPGGIQLLQEHGFLPEGFIERLENNETPIAGLPGGPQQTGDSQ